MANYCMIVTLRRNTCGKFDLNWAIAGMGHDTHFSYKRYECAWFIGNTCVLNRMKLSESFQSYETQRHLLYVLIPCKWNLNYHHIIF